MRQLLYAAAAAIALAVTPFAANASVMSITLSESGFPSFTTPTSSLGAISIGPINFGTFLVNQVSAQDQSTLSIPGILNSQSLNISGTTAGVLTIDVLSTGLIGVANALATSSFAVNSLNLGIFSVTEITKINGVTLATNTFNSIGTALQNDLVDLGPGGTFTAEDIFIISASGAGNANLTIDLSGAPIPEPASLALLGAGLLGVGFVKRRKLRA